MSPEREEYERMRRGSAQRAEYERMLAAEEVSGLLEQEIAPPQPSLEPSFARPAPPGEMFKSTRLGMAAAKKAMDETSAQSQAFAETEPEQLPDVPPIDPSDPDWMYKTKLSESAGVMGRNALRFVGGLPQFIPDLAVRLGEATEEKRLLPEVGGELRGLFDEAAAPLVAISPTATEGQRREARERIVSSGGLGPFFAWMMGKGGAKVVGKGVRRVKGEPAWPDYQKSETPRASLEPTDVSGVGFRVPRDRPPTPTAPTRKAVRAAEKNQRPVKTYRDLGELMEDLKTRGPEAISVDAMTRPAIDLTAEWSKQNQAAANNMVQVGRARELATEIWARPSQAMKRNKTGQEVVQGAVRADEYRIGGEARTKKSVGESYGKLSRKERKLVVADEGQMYLKNGPYPTPAIREFWETWDVVAKEMKRHLEEAGIKPQKGRYLPEVWNEQARLAFFAKKGPVWEGMNAYARDKGLTEGLRGAQNEMFTMDPNAPSLPLSEFSSFKAKKLGFPSRLPKEYGGHQIWDPSPVARMDGYLSGSWRRLAVIREFGKDAAKIKRLWDEARGNPQLQHNIEKTWQIVQGIPQAPGFYEHPAGQMIIFGEAVARPIHLSAAGVANLTGFAFMPHVFGLKNTMRAVGDMTASGMWKSANPKLRRNMATNMMDFHDVMAKDAGLEGIGGPRGVSRRVGDVLAAPLKVTLTPIESALNNVSSRAGVFSMFDMLEQMRVEKPGIVRRLWGESHKEITRRLQDMYDFTEADVVRMTKDGMLAADIARVTQRAPALVNNFLEGTTARPFWMRHPAGQRLMSYMSFIRVSGNLLSDAVKAAKRGNVAPLATYLFYKQLSGEAEADLKALLKNRIRLYGWDEFEKRMWDNWMKAATWSWAGAGYERFKYSSQQSPVWQGLDVILPPQVDFYTDMVRAVEDIAKDPKWETAEKHARRIAPIVDVGFGTGRRIMSPRAALDERKKRLRQQQKYDKGGPFGSLDAPKPSGGAVKTVALGLGVAAVAATGLRRPLRAALKDNYRRPLTEYAPKLYRQSNIAEAASVADKNSWGHYGQYYANSPDLALGQGKNKGGVLMEFDAAGIEGQLRKKPGWEFTYEQGLAEFDIGMFGEGKGGEGTIKNALRKVTIPKNFAGDRVYIKRFKNVIKRDGWTATENPDGSVTYTRPNLP